MLVGSGNGRREEERSSNTGGGLSSPYEVSSLGMSDHGEKIMVKIIKAEIDLFGMWNDIERKAHQVVG